MKYWHRCMEMSDFERFFRCWAKVAYARIKYFTLFRPSLHLICDWQWNVNNEENKAYDKNICICFEYFSNYFFIHAFLFQMILSCYIEFIQNIIWTYDEQWRVNFLKEIVNIKQNVYTFHENDDQFLSKNELQDIMDYRC